MEQELRKSTIILEALSESFKDKFTAKTLESIKSQIEKNKFFLTK